MAYNNVLPAWVFSMPQKDDPDYERWLKEDALTFGMPKFVRDNLLSQLKEKQNG